MDTITIFRITGKSEHYTDKEYVKAVLDLVNKVDKGVKGMVARFLAGDVCTIHLNDKLIYSRRKQLEKGLDEDMVKVISAIKNEQS